MKRVLSKYTLENLLIRFLTYHFFCSVLLYVSNNSEISRALKINSILRKIKITPTKYKYLQLMTYSTAEAVTLKTVFLYFEIRINGNA